MISLKAVRLFHSNDQNTPETMKTIIGMLIFLAAIALPLHAVPALPAASSVELKMTRTVKIVEQPTKEELAASGSGHVCFGDEAHYSLEPDFRRGLDAGSSTLVLNIYIITTNNKREFAILKPISQILSSDPTKPLITDTNYHHLIQWRCKCRTRGDTMNKAPEWYVEVAQDGKVLCSAQSNTNTKIQKLIDSRILISGLGAKALPVSNKSSETKPD